MVEVKEHSSGSESMLTVSNNSSLVLFGTYWELINFVQSFSYM